MSRCCKKAAVAPAAPMILPQTNTNCICSLPTLIILILVVLQFSRYGRCGCDGDGDGDGCCDRNFPIGNGILFIIALFFLTCAGCGRGGYGAY